MKQEEQEKIQATDVYADIRDEDEGISTGGLILLNILAVILTVTDLIGGK